jgi:hypothetical protein
MHRQILAEQVFMRCQIQAAQSPAHSQDSARHCATAASIYKMHEKQAHKQLNIAYKHRHKKLITALKQLIMLVQQERQQFSSGGGGFFIFNVMIPSSWFRLLLNLNLFS